MDVPILQFLQEADPAAFARVKAAFPSEAAAALAARAADADADGWQTVATRRRAFVFKIVAAFVRASSRAVFAPTSSVSSSSQSASPPDSGSEFSASA